MIDVRGHLPTQADFVIPDRPGLVEPGTGYEHVANSVYGRRSLDGLTGITLHYTAGSPNHSPAEIARIQMARVADPSDGTKFPGLAYTYYVDGAGKAYLAWDLDVRVWHSAAPGYNTKRVSICYAGNHEPSGDQKVGIMECIEHVYHTLGRELPVDGHKDGYATECPGPTWPTWKDDVLP